MNSAYSASQFWAASRVPYMDFNNLPTMPSEYVLFCGLHFIKMNNDRDILPANTQEQERELWLSSPFRLWSPDFVQNRRMLKTEHNILFCVPKKLPSGMIKLRTRASWLVPELFLLHLLSTTIYYYLLYLYLFALVSAQPSVDQAQVVLPQVAGPDDNCVRMPPWFQTIMS